MSKRVQLLEIKEDDEDQNLRDLLEKYIRRSEELEKRESRVLKQVELVQSAVASLQAWNQSRRASAATSESVNVDLKEVEEETKKIKEETDRIQKEVRQKIEENKKLQDEIDRKKGKKGKKTEFVKLIDEDTIIRRTEREEIESRTDAEDGGLSERNSDRGIEFFNEKLQKLKEMEKKLKEESELELEEAKKQNISFKGKAEWPKWESKVDEQLVNTWKEKLGKK